MITIILTTLNMQYLDGTDALVNGSVNYLIHEEEMETLELLNKWNFTPIIQNQKIEIYKM